MTTRQTAESGREKAVERIASLIKEAFDEWDSIHADGWNEAYRKLVPTAYHQAAKAICEHLGLELVKS